MDDLLHVTDCGLYCEAGRFYVDPWRPVERAVITHAHSDHARRGSKKYLAAAPGASLLTARLGTIDLETLPHGKQVTLGGVRVSFHPAGHILGSSQVRIERGGHVWVVTGDYKTDPDPTCRAFELVRCHTLVTECTFGLPVYRWPKAEEVFASIHDWWRRNQEQGRTSVVFGYALGKAQRILGGLDPATGPIFTHGAVENIAAIYRREGVALPPTTHVTHDSVELARGLVVAPESANGSLWLRRFSNPATAFASGWMMIRGRRRQRSVDRGFILSDHVDWPSLLRVIEESGAERVLATHGYAETLSRYLREKGMAAEPLPTHFRGETDEVEDEVAAI